MTPTQVKRGKELATMPDAEFLRLWDGYKDYTPNELNTVEPFYIIVAIQKLRTYVEGK